MPTDLEHDLRHLGSVMLRDSAPITADEVTGTLRRDTSLVARAGSNGTPLRSREQRHIGPAQPSRRPWLTAAAVTVVVAGVVAVWVTVDNRSPDPAPADRPSVTQPDPNEPLPLPTSELTASGALFLDPIPDGWSLEVVELARVSRDPVVSTRVYAIDSLQPESGPAFIVDVIDVDAGQPDIGAIADIVEVHGTDGSVYERPPGVAVSFETDGSWITVTGYQVDREELLTAAEHVRVDGSDAVIDDGGLPAGVAERGSGGRMEAWFIDDTYRVEDAPSVRWESDAGASMWLFTVPGEPEVAALQRIGAATVTDVDVSGQPGFVATIAGDDPYRSLTWTVDGRIHMLGSSGLDTEQLVGLASTLRPATIAEWDQAVAERTPPAATIPADGGLPEPGSVVPHRVTVFPVINDSLVPDEGRGETYAYSTYSQAGIEVDGSRWIGAIAPSGWTNASQVVNIVVADPNLVEPVLGEPTRDPAITESPYEAAVELSTTVNGTVVQVIGTDVDVLYDVIRNIQPTIADDDLQGYTFDTLPDGYVDLTGPIATGWEAGAFPVVHVHNGALMMQVQPAPAVATIASGGTDTETITIAGRTGYLHTSPDSSSHVLTIDIDRHTSLVLSSMDLTRDELLTAARAVELVDDQTWQTTYRPTPAVVPTVVPTPAIQMPTTTSEPAG